ncbi:MAG: nickel pincer cofactor biosynthesis protein LarC [Thermodesulfovibrionales bacterium]|nr:nickel pincer cofactor biosynthesis protein LarC [Thermodesulfovibrionales bacterium]
MKIAYFDCFSGISGDMCLGAIIDAGADIGIIKRELKKIPVKGYDLALKKVDRAGISSSKVDVILQKSKVKSQKSEVKKWKDIEKIIKASSLSDKIKQRGLHIFKRLFETEARVHGEPFEKIHLHELGGIDCIVDIFGTIIGIDALGVEKIYVSSINLGSGTINTVHGALPVPAPATIELLKSYPVYASDIPFELTTPTGAAIITGLDSTFSPIPKMNVHKIGYGAGNKDIKTMPNTLRLFIGERKDIPDEGHVMVIETNIDDMNPQIYEDVMEKLLASGALDVFIENVIMKKGRPAIKLTVIADKKRLNTLTDMLFKETTTIGVRFYEAHRKILSREIKKIKTRYGDVRIKISKLGDTVVNISPEYEDLKSISKKTKIPIKKLSEEVLRNC